MTNEEQPQTQSQNPAPRPNQNWDSSSMDKGKIVFGCVIVAVLLILVFAVSMCSRESAVVPAGEEMSGGDILQRNVDAAFETGREHRPDEQDARPQGEPTGEARMQERERAEQEQETPEERQTRELQEQQHVMEEREKALQQQRDAVPSLLPENPPAPANLGTY